ncbi:MULTISPECIES: PhzF family phenazine biosynthesis protein [unclassified Sedimentibacter]|uniref:PhzF family phenazine biosynthesis protein n=1 Tax=unclassified Sedimentibacter TaxID=2649220 RepID=UPI0027E0F1DD|nr:PhzF family phenazine biosynthesis protein [Sedimentibacter sp. MB35-C1]WMJ77526.1 PhzF family phenazine biosynthesis protein [Sedimentibacter sp. MB35-C1]
MLIKAYTLNTFTKSTKGGNAAGVVLDADTLTEKQMKRIAAILGYSETAFVMKSDHADFKVRFFTPNEEVDLCGHATIGTYSVLSSLGQIEPGNYTQETLAGILNVEVKKDLSIMMNQPVPVFYETIDKDEIAGSMNIQISEIDSSLPIQIVSTGLRDIMVPVNNLDVLRSIQPDFKKIVEICQKYNAIGYHVFTMESENSSNAQCRNFAPLVEIPEESATGTSNGALACYLFKYGKINSDQARKIIFEQGYTMKKPSEILVSLLTEDNEILEVRVGGRASNQSETGIEI